MDAVMCVSSLQLISAGSQLIQLVETLPRKRRRQSPVWVMKCKEWTSWSLWRRDAHESPFFFCWNLCKWHSEERSPGWRAFGFIENSYVYDCAWKMSKNIFYACKLYKSSIFSRCSRLWNCRWGRSNLFLNMFVYQCFHFFPSHLGSFTPAPPECLFGLVVGGFSLSAQYGWCSTAGFRWSRTCAVPGRHWSGCQRFGDLHLIRQHFCPWEFYDIWQLMIPTSHGCLLKEGLKSGIHIELLVWNFYRCCLENPKNQQAKVWKSLPYASCIGNWSQHLWMQMLLDCSAWLETYSWDFACYRDHCISHVYILYI